MNIANVTSAAAVNRIPVGTILFKVYSTGVWHAPQERLVVRQQSKFMVVEVRDGGKQHGKESFVNLTGLIVKPTDDGTAFKMIDKASGTILAAYTTESALYAHFPAKPGELF